MKLFEWFDGYNMVCFSNILEVGTTSATDIQYRPRHIGQERATFRFELVIDLGHDLWQAET